jgi:four helix bundle protein
MNTRSNPILEKSYQLALQIIPIASKLQKDGEFILSRQLVRSGTSVGANVGEAQAAQSRADFRTKICIAEKETRETHY